MIQVILVFVIVLAAVMMTGGSLGKKVTNAARDFNIPMPGAYCPGDAGVVDADTFIKNIQLATKVAWNGKKACWLKQKLDTGTITYEDIYSNITDAMNTFGEKETDDCLGGYYSSSGTGTVTRIDWVFWWDDKATCNANGVFSSTWTWVSGKLGSSQNTLYFYKREDYCIGGSDISWYNPLGNSNIAKFSQSKGRLNDNNICRDETDSGGLDYSLPNIVDLSGESDDNAKTIIVSDIDTCSTNFEDKFMGGYANNVDYNGYFACPNKFRIKPDVDANLYEWFSLISTFSYKFSTCDLLNAAEDDIAPDEFNSVTWTRKNSGGTKCLYIIKDRVMINQSGMENSESHKLFKDYIYEIQPFYYFEERYYGLAVILDPDDIIIVIEDKT